MSYLLINLSNRQVIRIFSVLWISYRRTTFLFLYVCIVHTWKGIKTNVFIFCCCSTFSQVLIISNVITAVLIFLSLSIQSLSTFMIVYWLRRIKKSQRHKRLIKNKIKKQNNCLISMWLLIEHAKVHTSVILGEKTILIQIIVRFSKLKWNRKQTVVVN